MSKLNSLLNSPRIAVTRYHHKQHICHPHFHNRNLIVTVVPQSKKIGQLGLSSKKIGEDISKETTKDWKGLHVTDKLSVQNRQAKVSIVPSAGCTCVINALEEPEKDRKKRKNIKHNGNISLGDVIEIAKVMRPMSNAKDLSRTVNEILGTYVYVGCTIDNKVPLA